jgi:hypothetical protein
MIVRRLIRELLALGDGIVAGYEALQRRMR